MTLAISLLLAVAAVAKAADPWRTCVKDTGGTCAGIGGHSIGSNGGCFAARGDAYCSKDKKCLCNDGACAIGGVCVSGKNLTQDTGETCSFFGHDVSMWCSSKSGASCVNGKCMCPDNEYSTMSWCVEPGVAGCAASPERLLNKGTAGVCRSKCEKVTQTSCMIQAATGQNFCPDNSECKYAGSATWRCTCNEDACADDMDQKCHAFPTQASMELAAKAVEAEVESFAAIGCIVGAFALVIGLVMKKRRSIVQPVQLG